MGPLNQIRVSSRPARSIPQIIEKDKKSISISLLLSRPMTDRTPSLSHVKARIGGREKIIITKKVQGFVAGHFSGQWRESSLPQTILTILTCSIDQPRPSSAALASHVHNKLRPTRSVDQHKESIQQLSQRRSIFA